MFDIDFHVDLHSPANINLVPGHKQSFTTYRFLFCRFFFLRLGLSRLIAISVFEIRDLLGSIVGDADAAGSCQD